MDAHRLYSIVIAALLVAAACLGTTCAQARTRIYVGTLDVVIEAGQPYYRTDHSRVLVETDSAGNPRYYRYDEHAAVAYHHRGFRVTDSDQREQT